MCSLRDFAAEIRLLQACQYPSGSMVRASDVERFPRNISPSAQHSGQVLMFEGKSCSYFMSFTTRFRSQSGATAKSPFLKARYCLAMSQNLEDTPYPHAPTAKRVHLLSSGVSFRGSRKRAKATGTQR